MINLTLELKSSLFLKLAKVIFASSNVIFNLTDTRNQDGFFKKQVVYEQVPVDIFWNIHCKYHSYNDMN